MIVYNLAQTLFNAWVLKGNTYFKFCCSKTSLFTDAISFNFKRCLNSNFERNDFKRLRFCTNNKEIFHPF